MAVFRVERNRSRKNLPNSRRKKAIPVGLCFSLSWHFLAAGARSIILSL